MSSCDPLHVPEILRLVLNCRHVLQPIDLASTSLVSKTWYFYSREALWQEVVLDGESLTDLRYEDLFRQLTKYGHCTKTLVLKECDSDRPRFNALLPTMPNLQAILVDRAMLYNRASPTVLLSLEQYSCFSSLRYLNLPFICNSGSGIESLLRICASAYGARHLDLVDSEIDDAALTAIALSCPKLKSLDLSRNEMISFRGFLSLASPGANPNLERRAQGNGPSAFAQGGATNDPFSNGAVSSDAVSAPNSSLCLQQQQQQQHQQQQQQQCTSLYARYQLLQRVSDHTQQHSARSTLLEADVPFMHLEELSLVFCFGIANTEFQTLFRSFQHKSLRSLNLQFTNIEDSALETLASSLNPPVLSHGDACGGLSSLNLNYCSKITARGIKALVEGCPQLRELEFLSCDLVSAECFRGQEPWVCTKLRRLEFTFHPRVLFTRYQQEIMQANRQGSECLNDGEEEGERERTEVHGQESTESGDTPSQAVHFDPPQLQSKIPSSEFSQPEEQHQDQMDTSYMYNVHPQQHQQQQQQQQQQLLFPQKKPQGNDEQGCHNTSTMHTTLKKDLWSYEQESVRSDYHAMFKQLKRLKDLRSLHIYNSPALNSSVNRGDPYQEGAAAPWMPDGAFFFGGSTVDTTAAPSSEASRVESLSDGASSDSTSFLGFQEADEGHGSNGVPRGEETNLSQAMYMQEESSSDFDEQANISGGSSSTSSNSNHGDTSNRPVHPHFMQASSTGTATVAEVSAPVHPFSLRIGLRALERLTQLESLTLYERSNIPFGSAEARWICKAFPRLTLLQLRGAFEIADTVLGQLKAKRPDLKVQVCSLFE
ncbi:unnamed protein product [Mortierella alpina]